MNIAQVSDFALTFEGSLYILWPQTDEGRAWIDDHIADDHMGWCANAIAIESGYVGAIIDGIHDADLSITDIINMRKKS